MYISVADKLYISGLDLSVAELLVDHYKIPNPAFAAIKRFSKYGVRYTKVPKFLYGGHITDKGQVILPRCVTIPADKLFDPILNAPVNDARVVVNPTKFPAPALILNPMQEQLKTAFISKRPAKWEDTPPGFLAVAGTSFGKTVALLELARLIGQPTLILIHRSLIQEVWINDIIKYFDGKADMGIVQNHPRRWTIGKHFTVAMEQTLHAHPEAMKELFPLFGTVIQDECFVAGTKIATPTGYSCIENIRVGDFVLTKKNKKIVARQVCKCYTSNPRHILRVRLNNGITIECTANHKFYKENGHAIKAEKLKKGTVLQLLSEKDESKQSIHYAQKMQVVSSQSTGAVSLLQKNSKSRGTCNSHGGSCNKRKTASFTTLKSFTSGMGKKQIENNKAIFQKIKKQKTQNMVKQSLQKTESNDATFNSTRINPYGLFNPDQTRKHVCTDVSKGSKGSSNNQSETQNRFYARKGGRRNRRAFSSQIETASMGQKKRGMVQTEQNGSYSYSKQTSRIYVESVEKMPYSNPTFNLEVEETHTYFANGVLVSNCHICPMPFIQGILNAFPAMYRLGGTATPTRPHRMHEFLYWILGKPFFSTTDTSLASGNQLSIDEVIFIKTKFRYTPEKSEVFDSHELTEKLIFDKQRNEQIIERIMEDQRANHCVLVASTRREHCNLLYDMLTVQGIKPLLILGGAQSANKTDLAELMTAPTGRVVLATEQLIREGANIPPFDRLHIVVPLGSRGNTLQLCGRICRKHPTKTDAKVIVYFDMGCPALRKRVASPMMAAFKDLKIPSVEKVWFL